jgi:hypothetical protein
MVNGGREPASVRNAVIHGGGFQANAGKGAQCDGKHGRGRMVREAKLIFHRFPWYRPHVARFRSDFGLIKSSAWRDYASCQYA